MKGTRVLQRNKLNADSYAYIRLVVNWEGKRIAVSTGCLVQPAHCDAKLQLMQVRRGTQYSSLNPMLAP